MFILMILCTGCATKKEYLGEPTNCAGIKGIRNIEGIYFSQDMFRIEQMKVMKRKVITEWPAEKALLFHGFKKRNDFKINNKADHLKAIKKIPTNLLKEMKIGDTREIDGWFYTSVDPIIIEGSNSLWFQVIASRKSSDYLHFSNTW